MIIIQYKGSNSKTPSFNWTASLRRPGCWMFQEFPESFLHIRSSHGVNVASLCPAVVVSDALTVSSRPLRAVGSIRDSCVNTVSPSSLSLRLTGFRPFLLPPVPLNHYFSFLPPFPSERQPLSSLHWWELLSSYTIHSLPSCSLTSPCTFAFSGLYKPSHLCSHFYFFFLVCNFLLWCLSLHLCADLCVPAPVIYPPYIFPPFTRGADVDSGWLMFRQPIALTTDLQSRGQNGQQYARLPPVKFSAPAILVEKQLGFGISVQIKEELNRLGD